MFQFWWNFCFFVKFHFCWHFSFNDISVLWHFSFNDLSVLVTFRFWLHFSFCLVWSGLVCDFFFFFSNHFFLISPLNLHSWLVYDTALHYCLHLLLSGFIGYQNIGWMIVLLVILFCRISKSRSSFSMNTKGGQPWSMELFWLETGVDRDIDDRSLW